MTKITKYSFDDLSMILIEIKSITINYWYDINYVKTCIEHDVHEWINNELITTFFVDKTNVIEISDNEFDVDIHKSEHKITLSHALIFYNFFQINLLIEMKSSLLFVTLNFHIEIINQKFYIDHLKTIMKNLFDLQQAQEWQVGK